MSQDTMFWINCRVNEVKAKSLNEDDQHDCITDRLFMFTFDSQSDPDSWQYNWTNQQYFDYYCLSGVLKAIENSNSKKHWVDNRIEELEAKETILHDMLKVEDCYYRSQSRRLLRQSDSFECFGDIHPGRCLNCERKKCSYKP